MNSDKYLKSFIGFLFIATGVLYIFFITGLIPGEFKNFVQNYWPVLPILAGAYKLIESVIRKKPSKNKFSRIYWSFALLICGLVLLENRIRWIFDESIDLWSIVLALLIIYIGIMIMFFKSGIFVISGPNVNLNFSNKIKEDKSKKSEYKDNENTKDKQSNYAKSQNHFVGELRLGDNPWVPDNSDYSLGVGDVYVDFTTALLEEGSTNMNLSCWVGDMTLIIPDDMDVEIYANVNIGSVELFGTHKEFTKGAKKSSGITSNTVHFKSDNFENSDKKLVIKASVNIGEITVKKV